MEITTRGIVYDITGDYPLIISNTEDMIEIGFDLQGERYTVGRIMKDDLVMAIIGISYDQQEETKN